MKIEVVDYNPRWPSMFEAEAERLQGVIGFTAIAIHHIGSTAVPGLAAKPVIDMLLEVAELQQLDGFNAGMIAIGYEPIGEFGIPGRRYFRKGGDLRTHHVHAFASGDFNLRRHLAFRDYLRANPAAAAEYAELKRAVAHGCGNDLVRYNQGKDAYVKRLEALAVAGMAPESGC